MKLLLRRKLRVCQQLDQLVIFHRNSAAPYVRKEWLVKTPSFARVEALSTQIQEKDKEMAEKIEAQKEEIRTLEAKMQAQLQAQAKRFMGVMRMPLSAFDGSSSQDSEEVLLPHYTRH
ncbi:hypothetical protein H6P81_013128 [Aristolochia fimbriata]|uniref:Uncharacterized protein n=1 Tax=Aristolochia fimbriata TaxID=158543 RepID=A0AAV7EDS4_ARIFI|nr:hypothetical protein H6P81_013128 [Aristolochia fimbriata]